MQDSLTLSGDYGFGQVRLEWVNDLLIDARLASWTLSNLGDTLNRYPMLVTDARNVVLQGGHIDGLVPLDTDWVDTYVNSAAVHARDSDGVTYRDWRVSKVWDAIRVSGDDAEATFEIENVWLSDVRDDAVENDDGLTGTIRDSLFENVFVGVSLIDGGTTDQTDQIVTLDNVLIRMGAFEYKGETTHQSPFKMDAGRSPALVITDSVIAISDVRHRGLDDLRDAWESIVMSEGNVFLNLTDEALPGYYPALPDGFDLIEGQEARAYWTAVRSDFVAGWDGGGAAPDAGAAGMVGVALFHDHATDDPLVF